MPNTNSYYPALSDVTRMEDLPDILGFLKDGIQELFNDVFYKNFQFSKSINGDIAFYSLGIVSAKKLAIELPGTGIFLVLNSDHENFEISSFPITVSWNWKILRYKRFFNINNFSFSVEDYFYLLFDVLEISEVDAIDFTLKRFVQPLTPSVSVVEQFVNDINAFYNTNIPIPQVIEDEIDPTLPPDVYVPIYVDRGIGSLVLDIHKQANVTAYQAIFTLYIAIGPLEEQENRLNAFFFSICA